MNSGRTLRTYSIDEILDIVAKHFKDTYVPLDPDEQSTYFRTSATINGNNLKTMLIKISEA